MVRYIGDFDSDNCQPVVYSKSLAINAIIFLPTVIVHTILSGDVCVCDCRVEGDASFGAKSDATAASARNGEEDNASAERTKEVSYIVSSLHT